MWKLKVLKWSKSFWQPEVKWLTGLSLELYLKCHVYGKCEFTKYILFKSIDKHFYWNKK